jgi:hypothetical protein
MNRVEPVSSSRAERRELVRSALAGAVLGLMVWAGTSQLMQVAWADDPVPPECYDGSGGDPGSDPSDPPPGPDSPA